MTTNTTTAPARRKNARLVTVRSVRPDPSKRSGFRSEWVEQFRSFAAARRWIRDSLCEGDFASERVAHVGDGVWFIDLH
jgi:hypothetical protein